MERLHSDNFVPLTFKFKKTLPKNLNLRTECFKLFYLFLIVNIKHYNWGQIKGGFDNRFLDCFLAATSAIYIVIL